MLRNLFKSKKDEGFTIIEVLIVLAIAGIILVVVLIAVPQLQRNQRNEARRNVLARLATEVNNYASNNGGRLHEQDTTAGQTHFGTALTASSFFGRYLGCDGTTCTANIDDPRHGEPVGTGGDMSTNVSGNAVNSAGTAGNEATVAAEFGSVGYSPGYVCNGELAVPGDARQFAIQMRLEGGALACVDNL